VESGGFEGFVGGLEGGYLSDVSMCAVLHVYRIYEEPYGKLRWRCMSLYFVAGCIYKAFYLSINKGYIEQDLDLYNVKIYLINLLIN
jgi:hypothetical protein